MTFQTIAVTIPTSLKKCAQEGIVNVQNQSLNAEMESAYLDDGDVIWYETIGQIK